MTPPSEPPSSPRLSVRGAREHNLQAVDLDVSPGTWTSVVGPSGSGKTSLVFDVILREGERRYLGATSPKARQFFGKLGRADVEGIEGLPVPMAVARRSVTSNPRSTVGTQSGVLDLLRLLFSREAGGSDVDLTRSHFSFNTALGACPACGGLGEEDAVDPALLIADEARSIREGALVPTLKSGYTVYSQVTLEVMDTICRAHGFDVDTPWRDLTEEQRHVILYGTKKLVVPFGKHSLESRMKWEGITARPREEGHYRGIVPVIEETLKRGRNPNIMRFVRSTPCGECGGSRLSEPGRSATLPSGTTLPELCALQATALAARVDELARSPVGAAIAPSLRPILERMVRLGLGHLSPSRAANTLSGGEAQRLRLAAHLTSGLSGALYALDEPTLGLHPESRAGMRDVLDELVAEGNTLVVVEHDPGMVGFADRAVSLGPGAGPAGGRIVGDTEETEGLLDVAVERTRRRSTGPPIRITGATLHNLESTGLEIERGVLNVVVGPSGAGKSSLVFGTLLPALTGQPGGPFEALEGVEGGAALAVDARPMGRSSRSTPATWSGLFDLVRKRFAETDAARERGWGASHFSFNGKKGGRCVECEGLGRVKVGLHLFEDATSPCPRCDGQRFDDATLEARVQGANVAEVLAMDVDAACEHFADDPAIRPFLTALQDLGLGYLELGAPSTTLSSGEAQRIRLATIIAAPPKRPALFLFDEPDRGLHPADLARLVDALDVLCAAGHTVLCVSHHQLLWRAADVLHEVREGRARRASLDEVDVDFAGAQRASRPAPPETIELRGVRTHNLDGVDVSIPRGAMTAIVGPSGSGKSSLAFDTIAAEAWRRYAECLPFQVRRFMERAPRPELVRATGLTPVVALSQSGGEASGSSTVATLLGVAPLLRLLWARAGDGPEVSAGDLRADGGPASCPACAGRGRTRRCSAEALLTDSSLSLAAGAMGGTRPGAFFTEPDGQHLATLRAATGDDLERPWDELPEEVRRVALEGAGDEVFSVVWRFKRGKREGEHTFEGTWPGLLRLVEEEAARRSQQKAAAEWAAPLVDVDCAECDGSGMASAVRSRAVEGLTLGAAFAASVSELCVALEGLEHSSAAAAALVPEIDARLADLAELGGGALPLATRAADLAPAELQRLRLAAVLRSGLTATTVVLDEPAAGLDPAGVEALLARLERLRAEGNTIIAVTHRPELVARAEHVVALGPGGGPEGGRVVGAGRWEELAPEARAALEQDAEGATGWPRGEGEVRVGEEVLPRGGVVRWSGPGASRRLRALSGADASGVFGEIVDPTSALRSRAVVGVLDVMGPLQALFASTDTDLPRAAFSFASPKGRCVRCKGSGVESVAMDFTADLALPCEACGGTRYRPEVLEARWRGLTVADVLGSPLAALDGLDGQLAKARDAVLAVGLGHLALGRATRTLSGGERQRLALAAGGVRARVPALFLLEGPERGLSAADLPLLTGAMARLAAEGHTLVVASEDERLGPL